MRTEYGIRSTSIKNCRNTKNIIEKIQDSLQLDMGINGTGIGPKIMEYRVIADKAVETLDRKIRRMLCDGVPAESITILSPVAYEESSVAGLPVQLKRKVIRFDDFSIRSFPVGGIAKAILCHSVSSIL